MPKIRLKPLDKYSFSYQRTLQVKDINYGGHFGNDSLVTILHEARADLLNNLGLTELNLGDNKTGLIMADLVVNYNAEAFLFDTIKVESEITEIGNANFRINHKVSRDTKTIALAEAGLVCFNYEEKRISSVPEEFLAKIKQ